MSTAPENPKQVYRLTDMSVEEVSVVDRAANRRKFLMVKRESGMAIGSEVTVNADGSLSTVKPAENTPPADAAPEAPAADATSAEKALSPDAASAFSSVVETSLAGLTKAKALLSASGSTESVLDAVVKVADDLADSVFAFLGIEGDGTNAGLTRPAEDPEAPAGMGKRLEVRRAKRVVAKDAGDRVGGTVLAKVGAKMAKDRLDRLQAAYQAFGDILAEVLPQVVEAEKAKTPSMGHAEAGAGGQTAAVSPTVPEKKKTAKGLSPEAAATLAKASATIKKQAEQLGALRDSTKGSNAANVEGAPSRGPDVSWPLDMNDPVNEKNSGKDYFG